MQPARYDCCVSRRADSDLVSRTAPEAPSPSGARAAVGRTGELRLRVLAGKEMFDHDIAVISWALNEQLTGALNRQWEAGEILGARDCARLVAALAAEVPEIDLTPVGMIYLGDMLQCVTQDADAVRVACADAAERMAGALRREWDELDSQIAVERNQYTVMHFAERQHDIVDALMATGIERPRGWDGVTAALDAMQVEIARLASLLRDGAWIEIDRHVFGYARWHEGEDRVAYRAVCGALDDGCALDVIPAYLARALELTGRTHVAVSVMRAEDDVRQATGALLAAHTHGSAGDVNAFVCAVEKYGVTQALASQYASRLPTALCREQSHRTSLPDSMSDPMAFSAWLTEVARQLRGDPPDQLAALPCPIADVLRIGAQAAVVECSVEHLPIFQRWDRDDESFMGWEVHLDTVSVSSNRARLRLVASVGALIDGMRHTASAVFTVCDDLVERSLPDADLCAVVAECLAGHGIEGLDVRGFPVRRDIAPGGRPEPLADVRVERLDVTHLLGAPACPHSVGTWEPNRPRVSELTPGVMPADAMLRRCVACEDVVDAVPLHRVRGEVIHDADCYLARESFYRAARGQEPVTSLAELITEEGRVTLGAGGAIDERMHPEADGPTGDLATALFE